MRPRTRHPKVLCPTCKENLSSTAASMLWCVDNGHSNPRDLHAISNFLTAYGKKHCSDCIAICHKASRNLLEKEWSTSFKTKLSIQNIIKNEGLEPC